MSTSLLLVQTWEIILYVMLGLIVVGIGVLLAIVPMKTWFIALVSGAHVSMTRLVGMKLRRIKVSYIIDAYIQAKKAGLKIEIVDLETHYMAGGDVQKVVNSLISAHSAKFGLSLDLAKAIDLAGRDISLAVRQSVTPKVIETDWISAIAKNGIELKVKARITVRANISRLVGGAGEETILARVGEGIVTTVGSAETHTIVLENPDLISTHTIVLENPDLISKTVLAKGLDSGTSYEIISIDMADIDIGKNIGARLVIDQAEADKTVAQAKAEERRAMAAAAEQEMRARTQEMKAMVLSAEAEVPKAMAEAIKNGKMGVMDYYRIQNYFWRRKFRCQKLF